MKTLSLFILAFVLGNTFLTAQEQRPLWPVGKTPYAKPNEPSGSSPLLNLYPSKGSDNHNGAAVVICPGGGYGGLAADHEGNQIAKWFNERGVSAFVLYYRLGSQGYHFPTQLADVQRAVRLVRSDAKNYGIDPARIAIIGFSAGGHLASMGATMFDEKAYEPSDDVDKVSARPDFAVLCYPVISMEKGVTHMGSRKNLLGPEAADDDEQARHVSTDLRVTDRTPPAFIFQTNADTAVPAENAVRFFLALRKHKISTEMHIYQNGPHGVGLFQGDPILGTWSKHLDAWLKTNSFYRPAPKRTALAGTVSLDGQPVSWGSLTFVPEDEFQPTVTIRARVGKFSAKEADGPVIGPASIRFEGSIWEKTRDEKDAVIQLEKLSPNDKKSVSIDLQANHQKLNFDFRSR